MPCGTLDALCGKLVCDGGSEQPIMHNDGGGRSADSGGGYLVPYAMDDQLPMCKSIGHHRHELGMVKDGTSCALGRYCVAQRCVAKPKSACKCGRGEVCTNKRKCRCLDPDVCGSRRQARFKHFSRRRYQPGGTTASATVAAYNAGGRVVVGDNSARKFDLPKWLSVSFFLSSLAMVSVVVIVSAYFVGQHVQSCGVGGGDRPKADSGDRHSRGHRGGRRSMVQDLNPDHNGSVASTMSTQSLRTRLWDWYAYLFPASAS